jgi:hypothetical protein
MNARKPNQPLHPYCAPHHANIRSEIKLLREDDELEKPALHLPGTSPFKISINSAYFVSTNLKTVDASNFPVRKGHHPVTKSRFANQRGPAMTSGLQANMNAVSDFLNFR